jgi:hypothetical protein
MSRTPSVSCALSRGQRMVNWLLSATQQEQAIFFYGIQQTIRFRLLCPTRNLAILWTPPGRMIQKMLLAWSVQNNTVVYLMNSDGSAQKEIQLGMYISTAPQFVPGDQSIFFYGSNSSSFGLFEFSLDDSQIKTISNFVEDETGFAWSPDGSRLAYFEMDRVVGEARLVVERV